MTNLIKLDPNFRVLLPEGATGGAGELEYASSYRVAALLAGATSGVRVVLPDAQQPRLGKIVPLSGQGDVLLLGATLGDPEPPYLTLRVYPTGGVVGRGDPITLSGRPHEHPPGSGVWDFHDLGGDDRPVVVSREQRASGQEVVSLLPEARRIPGVISEAEKAAADARALLEAQQGTLVYHLPGAAPAGMERFYTLDPANFQPSTVKVTVLGEERELDVIQAGM